MGRDHFLAAGFRNWQGGAALFAGDFDTAGRRLVQGMAVYEHIGERYWLSANLQHQAQVATAEGRSGDAVNLYGRSTETAREIGAVRILQMSAAGLGDANLADDHLEAAEAAYIQSLATSEQMGMVQSMLSLITKIARIRAATGYEQPAIELLASVLADPAKDQQAVFDAGPVEKVATATLEELRSRVDPDEFAAAHAAGTAVPYDVVAKELIASSAAQPQAARTGHRRREVVPPHEESPHDAPDPELSGTRASPNVNSGARGADHSRACVISHTHRLPGSGILR